MTTHEEEDMAPEFITPKVMADAIAEVHDETARKVAEIAGAEQEGAMTDQATISLPEHQVTAVIVEHAPGWVTCACGFKLDPHGYGGRRYAHAEHVAERLANRTTEQDANRA